MSSPTQYVSKKDVAASYRPKSYVSLPPFPNPDVRTSILPSIPPLHRHILRSPLNRTVLRGLQQMSPGLLRARAPFRVRNAITGVTIAALVVGVWAYSIAAVKQDSFADVDEEARILASSGSTQNIKSIEDEERARATTTIASVHAPSTSIGTSLVQPQPPVTATHVVTHLPGLASKPRGILVSLLDRRYPRLLDPTSKTLIWGAPSVDRIGRLRD